MTELDKKQIQRYEQTRIINLMGDIEDTVNKELTFDNLFPELYDYYIKEIMDHTETRSKIARFRCKLENTLKALTTPSN